MDRAGWSNLIPGDDCFQGSGAFRIDAYSEYMPPPRVGWKPYGPVPVNTQLFSADDPYGWKVHEFDETLELQPGLHQIAKQLMTRLKRLQDGNPETGLPRHVSESNPFWPPELARSNLQNDRCVLLLPLSLSRTQDDKGRVRWTLFGNSEQGPGKAFWKSFFTAPQVEAPAEFGIGFFCRLLHSVYGESIEDADGLRRAGFRILPEDQPDFPFWNEGELPSWAKSFVLRDDEPSDFVKYLVTFRQFGRLPAPLREGYLAGRLALLPFPGSLVFWGVDRARRVYPQLPLALQVPLLANVNRHESPIGIRVPQAGVLHVPLPFALRNGPAPSPGQNAGFLGTAYDPMLIRQDPNADDFRVDELAVPEEVDAARLAGRQGLLAAVDCEQRHLEQSGAVDGLGEYYRQAFNLLTTSRAKQAFDLTQEDPQVRERYGRNQTGQSTLLGRRLVEAGVPFVTVYSPVHNIEGPSWDTHLNNFPMLMRDLLPPADRALAALLEDMYATGLADEVLVVWMGEFGRTPRIGVVRSNNTSNATGRDHWPGCYSILLAGGGVRGGQYHGASDKEGWYPRENPVHVGDLATTIYDAFGIDSRATLVDAGGRPHRMAEGESIRGIW